MSGAAFISVNDRDHLAVTPIARELARFKFRLFATRGTAAGIQAAGLPCEVVPKISEGRPNILDRIANGEISLVIATPLGKESRADESRIRHAAIRKKIPVISTLSAAAAAVRAKPALCDTRLGGWSLQEYHDGGILDSSDEDPLKERFSNHVRAD
jgi:carbamoyl-phosphate synthase large subunit